MGFQLKSVRAQPNRLTKDTLLVAKEKVLIKIDLMFEGITYIIYMNSNQLNVINEWHTTNVLKNKIHSKLLDCEITFKSRLHFHLHNNHYR